MNYSRIVSENDTLTIYNNIGIIYINRTPQNFNIKFPVTNDTEGH